jgi:hypothetical protein
VAIEKRQVEYNKERPDLEVGYTAPAPAASKPSGTKSTFCRHRNPPHFRKGSKQNLRPNIASRGLMD